MRQVLRPGVALPLATFLTLALPVAHAQQAPAQAPAPAATQIDAKLPSARSIIDRHIKEIGGRNAILGLSSTHATGTISLPGPGLTGKLEVFHAKPNKALQRMSLPGIGDVEEAFDGKVGWSLSPMTGPTLVEGKQLQERAFDGDFHEELKSPERYSSITTLERTTFEARPVYKIRLVKKTGGEDIEFYDMETGLRAGLISTRESPMGPMQSTVVLGEYKKFGPLLQPTTMKVSMMGTQMVMSISTVEYDKVDPSVFAPPAAIKALIK
jgi:hypothetical protein